MDSVDNILISAIMCYTLRPRRNVAGELILSSGLILMSLEGWAHTEGSVYTQGWAYTLASFPVHEGGVAWVRGYTYACTRDGLILEMGLY